MILVLVCNKDNDKSTTLMTSSPPPSPLNPSGLLKRAVILDDFVCVIQIDGKNWFRVFLCWFLMKIKWLK